MVNKRKTPAPPKVKVTCGATTRTEDKHACRNRPIKGHHRCKFHGGKTPGAIRSAELAKVNAKLRKAMAQLGLSEPVGDPLTELSKVAGEIRDWKELLRQHVQSLEEKLRYRGLEGGEQIRGEVILYERAMDRAVQVLSTIAKLNIDERLAAIDERQAAIVDRALTAALEELGLPAEQRQAANAALVRHLRLVS